MILVKVEKSGGIWEFHEFDSSKAAAIYLIKNPDLKLRLAGSATSKVKDNILVMKELLEASK